jgi:hypothetical protein
MKPGRPGQAIGPRGIQSVSRRHGTLLEQGSQGLRTSSFTALEALAELLSGQTGATAGAGLLGLDLILRLTPRGIGVEVTVRIPMPDDETANDQTPRAGFRGIRDGLPGNPATALTKNSPGHPNKGSRYCPVREACSPDPTGG